MDSETHIDAPGESPLIVVRHGRADDADGAWRLYQAYLNWINVWFTPDQVVQRHASKQRTKRMLESSPSAVAEADGVVVGFGVTEEREVGVLEVMNLYVDDSYRHKGLGTRLLGEIESQCAGFGIHTLLAFGSAHYYPGKVLPTGLFRRAGFEVRELVPSTELYMKAIANPNESLGVQRRQQQTRRLRVNLAHDADELSDSLRYVDLNEGSRRNSAL